MATIHILLIEDNLLLREGISDMLNDQGIFKVVAKSENGDSVLKLKGAEYPPDVVLLDLGLAKTNSLDLMQVLKEELPSAKIIAMDVLPGHVDVMEFINAGGAGFILKNASRAEWIDTITRIAAGEQVLPPTMTQSLFTEIVELAITTGRDLHDEAIQLTRRELEIVDLIANGLSNKEIATDLYISTYTVKSHVHNILEKLDLNTRLQVAAFAHQKDTD